MLRKIETVSVLIVALFLVAFHFLNTSFPLTLDGALLSYTISSKHK